MLDKPIAMPFQNETTLEDVNAYIKKTTKGASKFGIGFDVDQNVLKEEEKSMSSTIRMGVEGVPLRTTLRLLLRQLGLAYYVKGGVVNAGELDDSVLVLDNVSERSSLPAGTKAIMARLNEPIAIPFARKTILKDVMEYITTATKRPDDTGIPIDVTPEGLGRAGKSAITLDLDNVPLRIALPMILEQLGLSYYVKDGRLIIDHPDAIEREKKMAGKD
jgi:hypothetical protein